MEQDINFIKSLCKLSESSLYGVCRDFLAQYYEIVDKSGQYIIAKNSKSQICLVAHLDTVFSRPPVEIYYDQKAKVMWGMGGLGTDDRAGVAMIIRLVEEGWRPNIIFTLGEETGGVGATALVTDFPQMPFENVKFLIELDRQGQKEVVYYNTVTESFMNYIESFGFRRDLGSFSDISILSPYWRVCSCNCSVGYINEHSASEILYYDWWLETKELIEKILQQHDYPDFIYEDKYEKFYANPLGGVLCPKCGKLVHPEDTFPVKNLNGKTEEWCFDCIDGRVSWCNHCNCAFELDPEFPEVNDICMDCEEKMYSHDYE